MQEKIEDRIEIDKSTIGVSLVFLFFYLPLMLFSPTQDLLMWNLYNFFFVGSTFFSVFFVKKGFPLIIYIYLLNKNNLFTIKHNINNINNLLSYQFYEK